MNAHPKFLATSAHVDDAAIHPLPRSSKSYVTGSRGVTGGNRKSCTGWPDLVK